MGHFWSAPPNLEEFGQLLTLHIAEDATHHGSYKTPSLSLCRPLHSALIVGQEASDGKHTMQSIHYSPELCIVHWLKTTLCKHARPRTKVCAEPTELVMAAGQRE